MHTPEILTPMEMTPGAMATPTTVITWNDDLTWETRGRFSAFVLPTVFNSRNVRLDLDGCAFVSPEGVAALLALRRYCNKIGTVLSVRCTGQVAHKLATMGVREALCGKALR